MNIHFYIKAAALATLVALTAYTVKLQHKHHDDRPALMKVTEMIVMKAQAIVTIKAHAEEAPKPTLIERAKKAIVLPHRDPPSHTKAVDGSAEKWTFPYSCSKVKWYAEHFSRATLETMRKAAGEPEPSGAQQAQIAACIQGRFQ